MIIVKTCSLVKVSASFTGLWRKTIKVDGFVQLLQLVAISPLVFLSKVLQDFRKVLQRMLNKGKIPDDIQQCLKQADLCTSRLKQCNRGSRF